MKSTSVTERERRRLTSVAAEYEKRGYEVKVRPAGTDLPEFLAGFEPDLIATGKAESVVVEVKARNELQDEQVVAGIEAALRNRVRRHHRRRGGTARHADRGDRRHGRQRNLCGNDQSRLVSDQCRGPA